MNSFKSVVFSSLAAIVFSMTAATFVSAQQLILPRPSQGASVTQTVGVTDITIKYSRPGVKGRPIFGDPPKAMAERAKGGRLGAELGDRRLVDLARGGGDRGGPDLGDDDHDSSS